MSLEVDAAIDIVAMTVIAELVRDHAEDCWEDHPEIGENDWRDVVDRAVSATNRVGTAEYEAAYALLTERADADLP